MLEAILRLHPPRPARAPGGRGFCLQARGQRAVPTRDRWSSVTMPIVPNQPIPATTTPGSVASLIGPALPRSSRDRRCEMDLFWNGKPTMAPVVANWPMNSCRTPQAGLTKQARILADNLRQYSVVSWNGQWVLFANGIEALCRVLRHETHARTGPSPMWNAPWMWSTLWRARPRKATIASNSSWIPASRNCSGRFASGPAGWPSPTARAAVYRTAADFLRCHAQRVRSAIPVGFPPGYRCCLSR